MRLESDAAAPEQEEKERPADQSSDRSDGGLPMKDPEGHATDEIAEHEGGATQRERSWHERTRIWADEPTEGMRHEEADEADQAGHADNGSDDERAREIGTSL